MSWGETGGDRRRGLFVGPIVPCCDFQGLKNRIRVMIQFLTSDQ